jgi:hypothetical protein
MASTTVSVRIDPTSKKRLEKLAKSTGRSRSFLAAEAINEYLDLNEWQVAAAGGIALHIIHNVEQLLPNNPQMGRPGTRESVIPKTPFVARARHELFIVDNFDSLT